MEEMKEMKTEGKTTIKVNDLVTIDENENFIYVVVGKDRFNRLWLSIDDIDGENYDGYDGDLIVAPKSTESSLYRVILSDGRSSFPRTINLGIIAMERGGG